MEDTAAAGWEFEEVSHREAMTIQLKTYYVPTQSNPIEMCRGLFLDKCPIVHCTQTGTSEVEHGVYSELLDRALRAT